MGKLDRFDQFLPAEPWVNPWQSDGSFAVDDDTLRALVGVAVGTSQASGMVAGAVDMWASEELRRAGFDPIRSGREETRHASSRETCTTSSSRV